VLLSGLYGPYLKAPTQRKSLKGPQKKRRRIGSILAVKLGLKNAGENAMPDQYNAPRNVHNLLFCKRFGRDAVTRPSPFYFIASSLVLNAIAASVIRLIQIRLGILSQPISVSRAHILEMVVVRLQV
jgi:hypothetical protein